MALEEYRLIAQLGAGSDGISYRAEDGPGRRSRAWRDDGRGSRRGPRGGTPGVGDPWRRDSGWRRSSSIPRRIRILDLGSDADPPYVVLEWVGTDVLAAAEVATGGVLRATAIEMVRSLAGALEEAHRLGLAHGRLGPGQIFLVNGRPKLDFTGIDAGFPVGSAAIARARRGLPRSASRRRTGGRSRVRPV